VPQVFPLLIDAPERVFPVLKKAGVPVIRFGEYLWEGMEPGTCPVSMDLSRRVFQLPADLLEAFFLIVVFKETPEGSRCAPRGL